MLIEGRKFFFLLLQHQTVKMFTVEFKVAFSTVDKRLHYCTRAGGFQHTDIRKLIRTQNKYTDQMRVDVT